MQWHHPELPGRALRLGYCLNLHPAEDLESLYAGLREITLPLRDRLTGAGESFGIGMYLAADLARELASPAGAADLDQLAAFLATERLDPFTFNAFPYRGFHAPGLKERVFEPRWGQPERLAFTLDVARIAARLIGDGPRAHVSISTHPGRHGAFEPGEWERVRDSFHEAVRGLAALEAEGGPRVVLSIEAEPRACAGDGHQLAAQLRRLKDEASDELRPLLTRHLGTCLDCCHSAVEFERVGAALLDATVGGAPLGKLQFSSALSLHRPGGTIAGRAALLALDEPRYLHQVTGSDGVRERRAGDLSDLAAQLARTPEPWFALDEWRCHFHVPVDLDAMGVELGTTRAHADRLLDRALGVPERWGSTELHVEIETYTWNLLPDPARGAGDLVDGLEREYRHVTARLESAGWLRTLD